MKTDMATTLPVRERAGALPAPSSLLEVVRRLLPTRRHSATRTFHLRIDQTLSVDPWPRLATVACRRGTCLVTQEGDPEDHVLVTGRTFRPARRGRVALWAFEESEIAFVSRFARDRPNAA